MSDTKQDIVRKGYEAFGTGDMETLGSLYTDDVVQSMPGKNQLSGEHKGRDDVLALYGKMFELSGGTFSAELKDVKTEGDKVVSTHQSKGERGGKTLDDSENIEFTFDGEKISRLDLKFSNQAAVDAFWA
jgi:uncharacterized protein